MTSGARRVYVAAASVAALAVIWAAIAARPWQQPVKPDPLLAALVSREARLRHDAVLVREVVRRRWLAYHVALARRRTAIRQAASRAAAAVPAAPAVRIVTLPPLTITRSS